MLPIYLKILFGLLIFLIIIALIISYIDVHRFVVRNYRITSTKLRKNLRICLLSDLHGKTYGENNEELIRAIDKQRPDLILFAGDVLTASSPERTWEKERTLVQNLSQKYPVYAANGNHEYKTKKLTEQYGDFYEKYAKDIRSFGVTLLENESADLPQYGIRLTGLEMAHYFFKKVYKRKMEPEYMGNMVGNPDTASFSLLIAHNPQYFEEYAEWGADLVVSGHIHGGIMRLPFIGGVISPAIILFPKYDGGLFRRGDSTMVLSRGLGTHTIPVRVFNPGELVVIDLEKA